MELSQLIKLQQIDSSIMELESSIGDLPQQVENLRLTITTLDKEIFQNGDELNQCDKSKRKIEGQIELLNEKLKKYQQQVYSVTTNKEYDAISAEIENTEREIGENETSFLELLEKEEKLTNQIQELKDKLKKIKIELNEKDKTLNEKLTKNKKKSQTLLAERKSIVKQIDRRVLSSYERIRKAYNGVALSEIKNYTCGECFATIPAQTVVEVRKMNSIITCESCGRILISTNNIVESEKSTIA